MFDVAFGDPAMLAGSMLLAGVGAFALHAVDLDVEHAVRAAAKTKEDARERARDLRRPGHRKRIVRVRHLGWGGALFKRAKSRVFGAATFPVGVDSGGRASRDELRGTRLAGVAYLASRKWAGCTRPHC